METNSIDLSRFTERLKFYFSQDPILSSFLDENYFWSGQGMRGKLCLKVGQFFDLEDDVLLDIAAFTEFLHNASLIHDDLIDKDVERRGHPTIWAKYGKSKALLVGDLLIAKAFKIASTAGADSSVKSQWMFEISDTVSHAVRGALNELEFKIQDNDSLYDQYFKVAADKTGVLFSLPVRCLAIASQSDATILDSLSNIFSNLAVAYQIKDDQADFLGAKAGRSHSSDILNGRPNLYHLLASSDRPLSETFTAISKYQSKLIESATASSVSLPSQVQITLEKLLLPFVELKPYPASHPEISLTT